MRKGYFVFSATFFLLAACSTLLLTWTSWWMISIGPSVPARRPFFQPPSSLPSLLQADASIPSVYAYTLQGGWPTANSAVRLVVSILGVGAAFSFALVANFRVTIQLRLYVTLFATIIVCAIAAAILDAIAIVTTHTECSVSRCVTNVPDVVLEQGLVCACSVEGWFYVTLLFDLIVASTALICLLILIKPELTFSKAALNNAAAAPPDADVPHRGEEFRDGDDSQSK